MIPPLRDEISKIPLEDGVEVPERTRSRLRRNPLVWSSLLDRAKPGQSVVVPSIWSQRLMAEATMRGWHPVQQVIGWRLWEEGRASEKQSLSEGAVHVVRVWLNVE